MSALPYQSFCEGLPFKSVSAIAENCPVLMVRGRFKIQKDTSLGRKGVVGSNPIAPTNLHFSGLRSVHSCREY